MTLDQIRAHFPILQRRNYLNSCSLGALSTRAEERLSDFVRKVARLRRLGLVRALVGTAG